MRRTPRRQRNVGSVWVMLFVGTISVRSTAWSLVTLVSPCQGRFRSLATSLKNEHAVYRVSCKRATISRLFSSTQSRTHDGAQTFALMGIDRLQDAVLDVLNELYDPVQVAQGNIEAKFAKSKQKKKPDPVSTPVVSKEQLQQLLNQAAANAKPFDRNDAMVTPATKAEFGDYQVNAALGLAPALGLKPRDCAQQIIQALTPKISSWLEPPEIAGPGFVNLKFRVDYLQSAVAKMARDPVRLAVPVTAHRQRIVVDYSSPNIAKEMHVGHLRSTIIGDTIANVLDFCGHDVVRLNHMGDWGTQFGMLVEHLRDELPQALQGNATVELGDLVTLYKAAKKRFDDNDEFKARARNGVVQLQAGDPEALAAWKALCAASRVEFQRIYNRLDIDGLIERGESFYNMYLATVLEDLEKTGLAVPSDGASVVYVDGYTNRDGSPLPMIVRKSDGGFNYATTDLAAIRHRTMLPRSSTGEEADRVLYVTDAGQAQHFQMVFKVAKLAKYVRDCSLEHVPFGLVQGEDGKKFATRSGDTVKLKDLLDKAVDIAYSDLVERNVGVDEATMKQINRVAKIVGIGAVKYADLSLNRESNYRFSYDRMLSLNGNTAPYMLYAYARICGIIRKASGQSDSSTIVWPETAEVFITHDCELELIRNLVKLPDVIADVQRDLYPNRICDYLFETTQKFSQFYENCSVNNAESNELKASRLSLCTATAGTIRLLMSLLGIKVVEKL